MQDFLRIRDKLRVSFNALPVQHHKIPNIKIFPLTKFASFSIPRHTPFLISAPEYVFCSRIYCAHNNKKKFSFLPRIIWMKIVFFFLKMHKFYACFMLFWKERFSLMMRWCNCNAHDKIWMSHKISKVIFVKVEIASHPELKLFFTKTENSFMMCKK